MSEMPQSPPDSNPPEGVLSVRRELEDAYARAREAMRRMEVQPLLDRVTPDFTQTLLNGQAISYSEIRPAFEEWSAAVDSVTDYEVALEEVSMRAGEAVVTTTSRLSALFKDPSGARQQGVQTASTRDTWVKTNQGWRMKRSDNVSEALTVDGRAVTL